MAVYYVVLILVTAAVVIGVIVAGILYLRHKYRPITDKDIDHKRPLGLS